MQIVSSGDILPTLSKPVPGKIRKILQNVICWIFLPWVLNIKNARWVVNNVDPDQMLHSAQARISEYLR